MKIGPGTFKINCYNVYIKANAQILKLDFQLAFIFYGICQGLESLHPMEKISLLSMNLKYFKLIAAKRDGVWPLAYKSTAACTFKGRLYLQVI